MATSLFVRLEIYGRRVGVALDMFLNALLPGGSLNQTISVHAALDAEAGGRIGCIVCAWLSLTVETDHCAKVLTSQATSVCAGLRGLVQLLPLGYLLAMGCVYGVEWVVMLCRRV